METLVEEEAIGDTLTLHEQIVNIFESCTIEADLSGLKKRLCDIYDSVSVVLFIILIVDPYNF